MKFQKPLRYINMLWISSIAIAFFSFVFWQLYKNDNRHLNFSKQVIGNITKSAECIKKDYRNKGNTYYLYKINMTYAYEFEGKVFNSTQIYRSNQGDGWYQKKDCQDIIRKLINANSNVDVWIDPEHPEFGVLDPVKGKGSFGLDTVSIGASLGFIFLILFIYLNIKREK
jgi:Protein of unknown function (DUF3592)